nr:carbohydrate porin [Chlamydia sp. 17-3921]
MLPLSSYAVTPTNYHQHRYVNRFKYNHQPSSKPAQPTQERIVHKHECTNVFSPIKNFLSSQAWQEGMSLTKLRLAAQEATNSYISLDLTILPQWVHPRKTLKTSQREDMPSWQMYFSPNISWELYSSPIAGTGTIDFNYTLIRYWQNDAKHLNESVGTIAGINDFITKESYLGQCTFSQTFPGNVITLTLGQYSLYAIDGTLYDNDQQSGFISYALSQNASATYSQGSIGAYLQISPIPEIQIQFGGQDAYNLTGTSFNFDGLTKNKYNFYGFFSWAPQISLGGGQYSILIYSTRSVPQQPSRATGWSFNLGQSLGEKLYIFGRWNGATGTAFAINRSIAWGFASSNPLKRDPKDLLSLGCAINKINPKALNISDTIRKFETVVEAFATVGFGPHLSLTPDFQLYIHPALRPERRTSQVYGIRSNLIF